MKTDDARDGDDSAVVLARRACRALYDGDRNRAAESALAARSKTSKGHWADADIRRFVDQLIAHLTASNAIFPDFHLAQTLGDLQANDPSRG